MFEHGKALTEGSGEGTYGLPSVSDNLLRGKFYREKSLQFDKAPSNLLLQLLKQLEEQSAIKSYKFITFFFSPDDTSLLKLNCLLTNSSSLFVEIPCGSGLSKEMFVTLLEYAEEILQVESVIVVFRASRKDRSVLYNAFKYLGFNSYSPLMGQDNLKKQLNRALSEDQALVMLKYEI